MGKRVSVLLLKMQKGLLACRSIWIRNKRIAAVTGKRWQSNQISAEEAKRRTARRKDTNKQKERARTIERRNHWGRRDGSLQRGWIESRAGNASEWCPICGICGSVVIEEKGQKLLNPGIQLERKRRKVTM